MYRLPRISIVTPAFHQMAYVAESIESVLSQNYSDVEQIVITDGSTDESLDLIGRYSHVKHIVDADRGRADAVNKAFRLAAGDIWGVLNADDVLLPGALHRVAREIDPERGRYIVMGRCRFVDERRRFIGVEHPSRFESHRRVLEVWKGHTIPQPAVFWTPEVWRTCGPMDITLNSAWVDFDLFCRFSRRYRFHAVDQVLATCRLQPEANAWRWLGPDRLDDGIEVSRRYWGSPLTPMYWQMVLSLALFRFDRARRARRFVRQGQESWRRGHVLPALRYALAGATLAPEVAFYVVVYPKIRDKAIGVLKNVLDRVGQLGSAPAQTTALLNRSEAWTDGWVGPRLKVTRETERIAHVVVIRGSAEPQRMRKRLVLTVRIDKQVIGRYRVGHRGEFEARFRLPAPLAPGPHTVEVEASAWFVPRNGDFRPLAWHITALELEPSPLTP